MELFDDIFPEQLAEQPKEVLPSSKSPSKKEADFNAEEWSNQKQLDREIAFELIDRTAEVCVSNPSDFQKYLNILSRFDRYSVSNQLLITAQRPDAVRLGSFDQWKSEGGNIKKGQKGFLVIEPGKQYKREDGGVGTYYNAKRIFDISQTTLTLPAERAASPIREVLRALMRKTTAAIVPCEPDQMPPGRGALYAPKENRIYVRKQMSENDTFKSLAVELAHLHFAKEGPQYSRQGNIFPAYCVSYALCQKYGIDHREYDFSRVPGMFKDREATEIRGTLVQIRGAAVQIIDRMTKTLTAKAPEQNAKSTKVR